MNIRKRLAVVGALIVAAMLGFATPASAQATRTWVSGVGDDVNPCSRTAPCKTFAGAISKTAPNGEINCLDPAAYGAVTITKPMSIICQYTEAGALATLGSNDIVINAGASDIVYLRGLDLMGANTGLNGVRFVAGGALHIQDCLIRNFGNSAGFGISFAPSASSRLYISNTTISDNNGASGGGVLIKPQAAGTAKIEMDHVRIVNNATVGLKIDMTGSSGPGVFVTVEHSVISGNGNGVHALHPAGAQGMAVLINDTMIVANSGVGVLGDGAAATVRVSDSTIAHNLGLGISRLNGSNVTSYGTNRVIDNTGGNGTFLAPNNTPL